MPGIFHQAGCCCATPCDNCLGDTPKRITAVFGGIALCTICQPVFGKFKLTTIPSVDPNGTFVLTQTAAACTWEYSEPCTGDFTRYVGANCTPPIASTEKFVSIIVRVFAQAVNLWNVRIYYATATTLPVGYIGFAGSVGGVACGDAAGIANIQACPGTAGHEAIGSGGTCSITV